MATAKRDQGSDIQIMELSQSVITVPILGTTPFVCNSMPLKAMQTLLNPPQRLSATQRQSNLKHQPMQEFRDSFYRNNDDGAPSLIQTMATGFKKGMGVAALRIPGATKTEISQLLWVDGDYVDLYGVPQLHMGVVRMADIAKTPDVKTRAILPEWCCYVTIRFITPMLNAQSVMNLLAAAGLLSGVGDWRQEKGSGNHGAYIIVSPDDPAHKHIRETQGRAAQLAAVEDPAFYDATSQRLFEWWEENTRTRGQVTAADLDLEVSVNGHAEVALA